MLILHKVQKGDTLTSIAEQYQIPLQRLAEDNVIAPDTKLNIGQIIVIAYPKQTYIVQEGDTLGDIAQANGVSVMELLRNNPSLTDREYLEVGEELVISYDRKDQNIRVNGMTFSFIDERVLKKTLPYLTYITVLGYQADAEGNLDDVDDENIIKMAINYGVIPLMLVSTINETGTGSFEITNAIFNNQELQNKLIDNVIYVIETKGYDGAVFGFQYVQEEDLSQYIDFIDYASMRLHNIGYSAGVVLIPSTFGYIPGQPYEETYFFEIGQAVDSAILFSYQWATGFIPNILQTSYSFQKGYLDVAITQIPPEKIYLGVSRIAYDFELPYVEGESLVSSLSDPAALSLASQYNSVINYDEETKFSYFLYKIAGVDHFVWFRDARQLNATLELVEEYGLGGITIWNIMNYFRIWLMINTQYKIVKLLPVE
jgi:spore germination protein